MLGVGRVGVADRDERFTDHQIVRGGAEIKRHDGQRVGGIDLDDGQIQLGMTGNHDGIGGCAVAEADAQGGDVVDDVLVGHDIAARVNDDAGTHAVDAIGRGGGGVEVAAAGHDVALAVDIDHRSP